MATKTKTKKSVQAEAPPAGSHTGDPRNPGRVDSPEYLTTNQGLRIHTDQHSLKAGVRGPSLLEDFHLREKITHFDHERIPERIVHARGSAAHGHFRVYESMKRYTSAKFLQDPKAKTPVFVRFSTVLGGAGSADTVRDVRGFAVKFYTEEGNFDLVGNNIPVFFIQDAIKFPDFVHAAKPEPHTAMPQAASAHDTFWDFVSLMPETMHMIQWAMSDRALPRSYRMMQGFGVHSFKLINANADVHFVKFHWKPLLGKHSLVWEEAQQLAGKDPDFHRRDLWEAIASKAFPEYELGIQLIPEADVEEFPIELLDATKLIPEEMVPVIPVGRLVLDRNPDNFFAETEQVAFHPGHIVPGIDFTSDPLLQGRLFSYLDTQLSRLGGPNFHEIPINRPKCPMHNLQRDGHMRHAVDGGRVSYEPSSLDKGAPREASLEQGGFVSAPEPLHAKVRLRGRRFFDHYSQATLFFRSQTAIEQQHIVKAFRFELGKVETPHVIQRIVDMLQNVDISLARQVAEGLGLELGKPPEKMLDVTAPVDTAPSLSLLHEPVESATSRKVAILAADGVADTELEALLAALSKAGAVAKIVAPHGGWLRTRDGKDCRVDHSVSTVSSTMFDAIAVPGGTPSVTTLARTPGVAAFIAEAYRHLKTIGLAREAIQLLDVQVIAHDNDAATMGIVVATGRPFGELEALEFVRAVAKHRHWTRSVAPKLDS